MVHVTPRPNRPHPKSNRSRRRARKSADNKARQREQQRLAAEVARAKAATEYRADRQREAAYFARFPYSVYPGNGLPADLGRFKNERDENTAERQRIWLRRFELWQKVRKRWLAIVAKSLDDRQIVIGRSVFYRDMRFWECRRCGWDAGHILTWQWWTHHLNFVQRLQLLREASEPGVRFAQRQSWQRFKRERRSAA